ncbi:hypothetical protein SS1G_04450 [Sclerotinia sclerotiorum 1980 UF-70]|uniref:Copper transport protein n=1 Tax=Sclerotinia sclerotiorum (strain ATCC 18683 / 1980 / Ss-1) TaxID=665079 RepID=A7EGK8_SCLS1|nr:hypothetical protein SS1G_04450 [Sclerotinia sclerotiorum 1980 UF-70]EDO01974.1 hypothetical protein SS1G_04450 [Sclerotinia sclerotiorum 1980 UF-70]
MSVRYAIKQVKLVRAVGFSFGLSAFEKMLFTWDTTNLCIIFRWWHIRSTFSLLISLLGVVAITAGYEGIRSLARRYESWVEKQQASITRRNQEEVGQRAHIIKAALYAFQYFYAFMLMLLFMTYNGWVMISVGVGAFKEVQYLEGHGTLESGTCRKLDFSAID